MTADLSFGQLLVSLVALTAVIAAAFRFGTWNGTVKASEKNNDARFTSISEKFVILAKQAEVIADLAKLVAAAAPSRAAWEATTETRQNATDENIQKITADIYKLRTLCQAVLSRQELAEMKHDRSTQSGRAGDPK